ncbi:MULTISPECIES: NVEALA domain-containing protein [Proteiniphilum]|jgi:hypothetical protein|uniref:NVEALA domain-containing protein n=1 Tax=Proteiniphilum TaxID=294702 RepID=UPI001EEC140D|nr:MULTISPECIES: NVEALA domain-containing protein [Proteiniphilum]MDD4158720.1 NVEALA domain-containing protein [Proteiniphilum sp.]ULB33746.1 NVEALA domain-containing protein [Proteiniphilum propionicum]
MTKKTILSSIFAIALVAVAGMGITKSVNNDANLSDLALANVEALADSESGGGGYYDCKQGTESSHGTREFWCGTCSDTKINKSGITGGCRLN